MLKYYTHICVCMGTKTISLGEDAYNLLASHKSVSESFTDVVKRLAGHRSLSELAGILTTKESNDLRSHVARVRKEIDDSVKLVTKRLE